MSAAAASAAPVTSPATSPEVPRRATVALCAAPRREPPFDDETGLQLLGPYDRRLPFGSAERRPPEALPPAPRRASVDPAGWAQRLLLGIIECAAGRRPMQQLAPLLSLSVASGLRADFDRAAARNIPHWSQAACVRSVHATEPTAGVAEVCATLQVRRRVRAVALRLEERHGHWRCTRLQVG